IGALADELGLPLMRGGSTTLRRRRKQRGLEPDRCFWIANEPAVRAVRDLDLRIHPPPDLAVETDVTNSSLDRMGIYAALGVLEVTVAGQRLRDPLIRHDDKGDAIGQGPFLVMALVVKVEPTVE